MVTAAIDPYGIFYKATLMRSHTAQVRLRNACTCIYMTEGVRRRRRPHQHPYVGSCPSIHMYTDTSVARARCVRSRWVANTSAHHRSLRIRIADRSESRSIGCSEGVRTSRYLVPFRLVSRGSYPNNVSRNSGA